MHSPREDLNPSALLAHYPEGLEAVQLTVMYIRVAEVVWWVQAHDLGRGLKDFTFQIFFCRCCEDAYTLNFLKHIDGFFS